MRESAILHRCMLRLTEVGCRVFRNNVGQLQTPDGRWVRYGLAVGSSDLIGWTPDGKFLAVECKGPRGVVTPEQQRFLDAVNDAGGLGLIARDEDAVVAAVLRFSHR